MQSVSNVSDSYPIALAANQNRERGPQLPSPNPSTSMCFSLFPSAHWHRRDIQVYQAYQGVIDSYLDVLINLIESIEHILNRLDIYTKITYTVAMDETIGKVLAELLSTITLATKRIEQPEGKLSRSIFGYVLYYLVQYNSENLVKKLFGENNIEAVVQRLDRIIQDLPRVTAVQTLEVIYGRVQNMTVMDGERIH